MLEDQIYIIRHVMIHIVSDREEIVKKLFKEKQQFTERKQQQQQQKQQSAQPAGIQLSINIVQKKRNCEVLHGKKFVLSGLALILQTQEEEEREREQQVCSICVVFAAIEDKKWKKENTKKKMANMGGDVEHSIRTCVTEGESTGGDVTAEALQDWIPAAAADGVFSDAFALHDGARGLHHREHLQTDTGE